MKWNNFFSTNFSLFLFKTEKESEVLIDNISDAGEIMLINKFDDRNTKGIIYHKVNFKQIKERSGLWNNNLKQLPKNEYYNKNHQLFYSVFLPFIFRAFDYFSFLSWINSILADERFSSFIHLCLLWNFSIYSNSDLSFEK